MSDSLYAPPKAAVDDIPQGAAPERPAEVGRAVKCLWTVFGLGIAVSLYQFFKFVFYTGPGLRAQMGSSAAPMMGIMIFGYLLVFAVSYWMYGAIAKGRNWARILFLIFGGLSLLFLPIMFFAFLRTPALFALDQLVGIVNIVISGYAGYLLLTRPAREWFRAMKGR